MKLLLAHGNVLIDKHPIPGDLDVVEVKDRVIFVEAAGERIVEDAGCALLV